MRNGGFGRQFLGGAFRIQVNPLVIIGGIGETINAVLIDQHPIANAQFLPDIGFHIGGGFYFEHRNGLSD